MNPVILFSLITFCVTVQVWLVLIAVSAAIPQANTLSLVVCPEWQYFVHPERDALLFHCFVGLALSAQAIGIWFLRDKLNQPTFVKKLLPFLVVEIVWTALMLTASFKAIVYPDRPLLARDAFMVLAGASLLSKIFWVELKSLAQRSYQKIGTWPFDIKADLCVIAGVILMLYIPDTKAVLARMFFGDHFHHFDSFMAPAWAFTKGAVLNVDVMTEYGIGLPVMMSWFSKLTGGFSYTHMLWFLMWGTIVYFIFCFIFLRRWLGSFAVALIGTLVAIKFQMFQGTIMPIVFTYPATTVMRFCWDIIFFLMLLGHLRTLNKRYLFIAAVCCGVQIFCMPTCGYCLTIAFFTYLAAFMLLEHLRPLIFKKSADILVLILYVGAVFLTTVFLLGLTQGSHLWTSEFWNNMKEFNNYFLSGFGLMPMYESLQKKEILIGLMGFFIPLVYLGTFLVIGSFLYWKQAVREDLIVAILSLYGLMMYHYYMGRSGGSSYYTVCIPYVFILCFWVQRALLLVKKEARRRILLALLGIVVYSLLTNHLYLSYPNLINVSRNPIVDPSLVEPLADGSSYFNASIAKIIENEKVPLNSLGQTDEGIKHEKDFKTDAELTDYYEQESDFSKDAAMITAMTKSSEPVALLSGFEIKMLMQANRRQLFYYSPILIARPMRMRSFPNSAMFTSGHAQRTLKQLQDAKPEYIFMEKIFVEASGRHDFKDGSLVTVLNYVFENYTPYMQGQYLIAMKRK